MMPQRNEELMRQTYHGPTWKTQFQAWQCPRRRRSGRSVGWAARRMSAGPEASQVSNGAVNRSNCESRVTIAIACPGDGDFRGW